MTGRSPDGSGYSAEPEPSSTVSAVPVSIPNAAHIALAVRVDTDLIRRRLRVLQGDLAIAAGALGRADSVLASLADQTVEAGERGEVTRFDPSVGDAEMLAILMWDFFGPHDPRTLWRLDGVQAPKATEEQVLRYRVCANHIAESLRFYRNIEFDAAPESCGPTDAMIERGADQLEVRYGDSWTSREDYREAAKNVFLAMTHAASADTHPKDGDVQQAPLVSGAVPKGDASCR